MSYLVGVNVSFIYSECLIIELSCLGSYVSGRKRLRCARDEVGYSSLSTGGAGATFFITLAGDPIATLQAGILRVTTEDAAIVHPLPIVTPGRITTCPPIQQSWPIVTGIPYSISSRRLCTSTSCVAAKMETLGPNMQRSPMVTILQSRMVRLKFA
ncbi:hypothetical protein K505DRAFT_144872 [Melanomma pulvis-pyrius CBS 109.77]|uniref:Uncharacterized protein n=1 Tax=Melanomma pulvis-pyrius CBS 109.77 TaxID=1314802 RepID=A0A6A6XLT2_9PLEO|nr:hypothetical protein K505DRAFT_144872 [Melanomma pulvis-pyrius CBS 109.77]